MALEIPNLYYHLETSQLYRNLRNHHSNSEFSIIKNTLINNKDVKIFQINEYIESLDINIPPMDEFLTLSRIFKIYSDYSKYFAELNYDRGALLYGLVAKKRPKQILEIGTAGGYSTMCMALAMSDNNIDGNIITVDPVSFDKLLPRLIDFDSKSGPEKVIMSTRDYWKKFASQKLLEKITVRSCYSDQLLEMDMPEIDFCLIDGHHTYEAVACDFSIFTINASKNFTVVFDDYINELPNHVKKVIELHVKPHFDCSLLKTNFKMQNAKLGRSTYDTYMCIISSDSLKHPLENVISKSESIDIIKRYRRLRKRFENRQKINKIFPFLRNIRFSDFFSKKDVKLH